MATETSFREMRTKASVDAVAKEAAKKGHVSVQAPEAGHARVASEDAESAMRQLQATSKVPERFQDWRIQSVMPPAPSDPEGYPRVTLPTAEESGWLTVGDKLPNTNLEITNVYKEHDDRGIPYWRTEVTPPPEAGGRPFYIDEKGRGPGGREPLPQPLPPMTPADLVGVGVPGFDALTQAAQALIGGRPRTGSPVGPEPGRGTKGLPTGQANDYAHYQSKYIYNEVDPSGVADAVSADLNLRVNQPEKYGTTDSSEHPDWRGTGWTMHTIEGEDATRYFLENPDTAEAYNLTGHPDAASE